MWLGVRVGDDGVSGFGFGLNGVAACIGDGEGSGVFDALLGRVAEVPSATRGV